jgi:hypothetical protein
VSPATSATYILKAKHADGGCTVTALSPIEITVHPTPDVAFVNPPLELCANTSATLTVNDANNAGSSYCFTYDCAGCVHNPYTCGNDTPAASACDWFSECIYDVANTYSVNMYDAGSMTVWVKAKTEYGCVDSAYTVITQTEPTITLISDSDWVGVAYGATMKEIKYVTTVADGATVTGVPPGVSGTWTANTYAIGGTPTQFGTFPYTVTTTNAHSCIDTSATGIIQVASNCPPATFSLGTVGFANTDTYTKNGITISAPVIATGCKKTSVTSQTDCRTGSNPDADLFTWCMCEVNAHILCPDGWRTPSLNDMCKVAGLACAEQQESNPARLGQTGWVKTALLPPAGSALTYLEYGYYYASRQAATPAYLVVRSDYATMIINERYTPQAVALRCVQDTQ